MNCQYDCYEIIKKLKLTTFIYNNDENNNKNIGFIIEDIKELNNDFVNESCITTSNSKELLNYENLNRMNLQATKKIILKLEDLQQKFFLLDDENKKINSDLTISNSKIMELNNTILNLQNQLEIQNNKISILENYFNCLN